MIYTCTDKIDVKIKCKAIEPIYRLKRKDVISGYYRQLQRKYQEFWLWKSRISYNAKSERGHQLWVFVSGI